MYIFFTLFPFCVHYLLNKCGKGCHLKNKNDFLYSMIFHCTLQSDELRDRISKLLLSKVSGYSEELLKASFLVRALCSREACLFGDSSLLGAAAAAAVPLSHRCLSGGTTSRTTK